MLRKIERTRQTDGITGGIVSGWTWRELCPVLLRIVIVGD